MAWTPDAFDFSLIPGMDPLANCLLGLEADTFLPEGEATLIPFVAHLNGDNIHDIIKLTLGRAAGDDSYELFDVRYKGDLDRVEFANVVPLVANRNFFIELIDKAGLFQEFRGAIKAILLSQPSPFVSKKLMAMGDPEFHEPVGGWPDDTVIMGVVDDGIAFAHERFRTENDKSRIYSFWNMDIGGPGTGELFKFQIDTFLTPVGGFVHEDQIYKTSDLIDFSTPRHKTAAWQRAHGTHVLDLVAGYPPEKNVINRPILAVQLPSTVVADTQAKMLDFYLIVAITNILRRANQLKATGAPDRPVVINMSFGYTAGPHDGFGLLERVMNFLNAHPLFGTLFVLPAGNSHLSRCHAEFNFDTASTFELDWVLQPNDLTDSHIQLWLPKVNMPGNRLKLKISGPAGAVGEIEEPPGPGASILNQNGEIIGWMQAWSGLNDRNCLSVCIAPTDRFQPDAGATAVPGVYKLTVEQKPGTNLGGQAHIWVQRDESLYGYPRRGRQSYLVHPRYVRSDPSGIIRPGKSDVLVVDDNHPSQATCPVTRKSLINAIATGSRTLTAGGYLHMECRAANYSPGGPTTPPEVATSRKPDVLLQSEHSRALAGVLAAGSRSGSVVALSGTSVAAPQLARHVAKWLEMGSVDRQKVKTEAQNNDACGTPLEPDRGGWGRLSRLDIRVIPR